MKKFKKIIIIIALLILSLWIIKVAFNIFETAYYKHKCRLFIEDVISQDYESIYNAFCDDYKNYDDFNNELDEFLGQLYSYDLDYQSMRISYEMGGSYSSYRSGKLAIYCIHPVAILIYDSDNYEYDLCVSYTGVDSEDTNNEGVHSISLRRVYYTDSGDRRRDTILYIGDDYSMITRHEGRECFYYVQP